MNPFIMKFYRISDSGYVVNDVFFSVFFLGKKQKKNITAACAAKLNIYVY